MAAMQDEHHYDTNLGWWTDKPVRTMRASPLGPIYGPYRRRKDRVWLKAALFIGLMVTFCWSLVRLAGASA